MICANCREEIPPDGRYRIWIDAYYCNWSCVLAARDRQDGHDLHPLIGPTDKPVYLVGPGLEMREVDG